MDFDFFVDFSSDQSYVSSKELHSSHINTNGKTKRPPFSVGNRLKDHGLIGLQNQGATCYLNSLLQALFYTVPFRNLLFSLDEKELNSDLYDQQLLNKNDNSVSPLKPLKIPIEFRRLFGRMKLSNREALDTQGITRSFGWSSDEGRIQQDIHELYSVLMEALNGSFDQMAHQQTKKNFKKKFSELFNIETITKLCCSVCSYSNEKVESSYYIPLSVLNADHIYSALNNFIAKEELTGSNAYSCPGDCKQKVTAVRYSRFDSLPKILTFALMRHGYDPRTWTRIKIGKILAFPITINMAPFMQNAPEIHEPILPSNIYVKDKEKNNDNLAQTEASEPQPSANTNNHNSKNQINQTQTTSINQKQKKQKNNKKNNKAHTVDRNEDTSTDQKEIIDLINFPDIMPDYPPLLYDLYCVIIYRGSGYSGHYFCYIGLKSPSHSLGADQIGQYWYEFNDSHVNPITPLSIAKQYQGQSECAYILMYKQRESQAESFNTTPSSVPVPVPVPTSIPEPEVEVPPVISSKVHEENKVFLDQCREYDRFMSTFTLHFFSEKHLVSLENRYLLPMKMGENDGDGPDGTGMGFSLSLDIDVRDSISTLHPLLNRKFNEDQSFPLLSHPEYYLSILKSDNHPVYGQIYFLVNKFLIQEKFSHQEGLQFSIRDFLTGIQDGNYLLLWNGATIQDQPFILSTTKENPIKENFISITIIHHRLKSNTIEPVYQEDSSPNNNKSLDHNLQDSIVSSIHTKQISDKTTLSSFLIMLTELTNISKNKLIIHNVRARSVEKVHIPDNIDNLNNFIDFNNNSIIAVEEIPSTNRKYLALIDFETKQSMLKIKVFCGVSLNEDGSIQPKQIFYPQNPIHFFQDQIPLELSVPKSTTIKALKQQILDLFAISQNMDSVRLRIINNLKNSNLTGSLLIPETDPVNKFNIDVDNDDYLLLEYGSIPNKSQTHLVVTIYNRGSSGEMIRVVDHMPLIVEKAWSVQYLKKYLLSLVGIDRSESDFILARNKLKCYSMDKLILTEFMSLDRLNINNGLHLIMQVGQLPIVGKIKLDIYWYNLPYDQGRKTLMHYKNNQIKISTSIDENYDQIIKLNIIPTNSITNPLTDSIVILSISFNEMKEFDNKSRSPISNSVNTSYLTPITSFDFSSSNSLELLKSSLHCIEPFSNCPDPSYLRIRLLNKSDTVGLLLQADNTSLKKQGCNGDKKIAVSLLDQPELNLSNNKILLKLCTTRLIGDLGVKDELESIDNFNVNLNPPIEIGPPGYYESIFDVSERNLPTISRLRNFIHELTSIPISRLMLIKWQAGEQVWRLLTETKPEDLIQRQNLVDLTILAQQNNQKKKNKSIPHQSSLNEVKNANQNNSVSDSIDDDLRLRPYFLRDLDIICCVDLSHFNAFQYDESLCNSIISKSLTLGPPPGIVSRQSHNQFDPSSSSNRTPSKSPFGKSGVVEQQLRIDY